MTKHIPVLYEEVLEYLDPQPNQHFIDGTFGGGGHTLGILEKTSPNGEVIAFDQDADVIERFKQRKDKNNINNIEKRLHIINSNFDKLKQKYDERFSIHISGVLLDLGLSSDQLEVSERGFSFQKSEPLDMRMQKGSDTETAADIVNAYSQADLEKILRVYGEEDNARSIAQEIVKTRKRNKILTTSQLVDIVEQTISPQRSVGNKPAVARRRRIHPATKTFQALRIAVNRELEKIRSVLPQAVEVLEPGGRIVVISFHSLEDKIAKQFFKEQERAGVLKIITKKPVKPTHKEIKENPRSRSAVMRVAQKTSP